MKKALITGGSSGIGYAFAVKLLSEGYRVVLLSRNEDALAAAIKSLRIQGFEHVSYVVADVRDPLSLRDALASFIYEPLDLVIHSAGILRVGDNPTVADRVECTSTNLQGTFNVLTVVTPLLQKSCGHIAVLCSVAGLISFPGYLAYGDSKRKQRIFCESQRNALADKGIGLIMIYPSVIRTPMITNIQQDQLPPVSLLFPWKEPTDVVKTFYRDIVNRQHESFVSFGDRVMSWVARIAPRPFLGILNMWLALKKSK